MAAKDPSNDMLSPKFLGMMLIVSALGGNVPDVVARAVGVANAGPSTERIEKIEKSLRSMRRDMKRLAEAVEARTGCPSPISEPEAGEGEIP